MRFVVILLALALLSGGAHALEPDEVLADPALEQRAREISKDLRCVVCQNQSIDESDAPLARDMRLLVRDRLVAGDSDAEVTQFLVDRYGDYVLLDPPFKLKTLALWLGPAVLLLAACGVVFAYMRHRQVVAASQEEVPGLTAEDLARLDALVADLGDDEADENERAPPDPERR